MSDLLALPEVERRFGIISIKKGSEVKEDLPVLADVGTIAVLRKSTTNEDGTFEILVIGGQRFDLLSVSKEKAPYLMADIKVRKETETDFDTASLTLAKEKCDEFMMMFDADNDNASQKLPDTPSSLSFLLTSLLPINNLEKQGLLEIDDANVRLKNVLKIINRETILMQEIPSVPAPFLTKTKISLN
jgi:Lon protease-like protein